MSQEDRALILSYYPIVTLFDNKQLPTCLDNIRRNLLESMAETAIGDKEGREEIFLLHSAVNLLEQQLQHYSNEYNAMEYADREENS